MSTYLFRLGRWSLRHRRTVLGVWLALLVAAIVAATASGGQTNDAFTIPGTESQETTDLLNQKLPALGGAQTQVVFATGGTTTVTDSAHRSGIEAAVAQMRTVPQVASVSDPFTDQGVSPDQHVALAWVQYTAQPADVQDSTLDALERAALPAQQAGVQVEYSGSVYPGWRITPSELPEIIGLAVALVILLITFGAIVAAACPSSLRSSEWASP